MTYDDIPTLVDIETRCEVIDRFAGEVEPNSVLVEVGVFLGGTIFRLATRLKERKVKCNVYAVDNFLYENISDESFGWANLEKDIDYYRLFKRNAKKLGLSNIAVIRDDSIQAASLFKDNSISYLFLDGNHVYDYVRNELEIWWPKIKSNGILAGHDFCSSPDIQRAVFEKFGKAYQLTSNQATYYVRKNS